VALPRCMFSVRYPAGDGRWWYQRMSIASPGGAGSIGMEPPLIGDLISLWDTHTQPEGGPVFRVIDRCWGHASWGSVTWPYGESEPQEGPLVDIILEPAQGPYPDETDICAESTCEAVWMNGAWWFPPGSDEPDEHEHRPYEPAVATATSQERRD
jgi:hypothetical protein